MTEISQTDIFLSIRSALFGVVTDNLRAVKVEYGEKFIRLYFFYDQKPSELELENAEVVGTEVFSDFAHVVLTIDIEKTHLPFPKKIPKKGLLVFHRYEMSFKNEEEHMIAVPLIEDVVNEISRVNVLVSCEKSLLGRVTPNLRMTKVEYGSNFIFLYFYYDQSPSGLDLKLADEVAMTVSATFKKFGLKSFKVNKIKLSYPQQAPDKGFWIYHRYEPSPENVNNP